MRRGCRIVVGALVLALVAAAAYPLAGTGGHAPASPAGGPGEVYLALGDSIAAGIGAGRPTEAGYAAIVHGYLERQTGRAVGFANVAVAGETSAGLLAGGQLERALGLVAAAERSGRRVSPITVTVGANDLIRAGPEFGARQDALRAVAANLRLVFARLRAATDDGNGGSGLALVATTYYDPTGSDPSLAGTDGWWIARLNEVIVRETAGAGGRIADVAARFGAGDEGLTRYPADIHPTDAGHRAIADEVWRCLGYDTTPPAVRLDRPDAGALSRPVPTVVAVATDRVGVVAVELVVDGAPVGELPYVPAIDAYAMLWDTRGLAPGPHTLRVRALDAAGNAASAEVVVEVQE